MNDKLKPCPFCGGKAEIYEDTIIKSLPAYSVYCTKCYARTYGLYDKKDDAIESWNRRVNENE